MKKKTLTLLLLIGLFSINVQIVLEHYKISNFMTFYTGAIIGAVDLAILVLLGDETP